MAVSDWVEECSSGKNMCWKIGHLWPSYFSIMSDFGMGTGFVCRMESCRAESSLS